jgi:hypothetical protein
MDPTQAHSVGPSLTVRLASADVDRVVQEVAEATLIDHFGSPLHIQTGPASLQVLGPGTSGALRLSVAPGGAGLAIVRFEGKIEGWEPLGAELRERFLRALSHHAAPVPMDGYCHALGFGRECDRLLGHTGHHLSVRGEPTAWARDGSTPISFESRFVVEDLLDRIHSLESMVDRTRAASRSTATARRPGVARFASPVPAFAIRPASTPPARAAPRPTRGAPRGHRRKGGARTSR